MKLYMVRHGETDWNKTRKLQGQVDIALNEFGRHLAAETGAGLSDISFGLCISSPLSRAVETAELILNGKDVPIVTDERIIEMAFGDWEGGCCSKEGWNLPEEFRYFFEAPERYRAPRGGEDFYMMRERLEGFLEELYQRDDLREKNVLITTHGAALCGMLNVMKNKPVSEYWGKGVHKNCAVTEVEVKDGLPVILSENLAYYKDEVKAW
ncbi:MAG: histidine phosphatase family protein [Dorea sp.]|nr:histidine phosphatase family protein [Dorea sp.]